MWIIARVDRDGLFEIQSAYRRADLDVELAHQSGFVAPDDALIIVSPTGREYPCS